MPTFPCPQCQNPIDPPPGLGGLCIACPYCGFQVPVPSGDASEFAVSSTAPPADGFVEITDDQLPADPSLLGELPEPLPAEIAALGPPLAIFRHRGGVSRPKLILGGLMLAVGLSNLFYILIDYLLTGRRHLTGIIPPHLVGAFWTACGAMLIERAWRLPTLKVIIFPDGLVRTCWPWLHVCRWNQVRRAGQYRVYPWRNWVCTVERDDGRRFHFDDRLDRIDVLGRIILRQTTPHLLKRALADHDAGRTIDFGMFQVSPAGVARGRDCLPWNRVRVAQRLKHRVWVWQWDQDKPWAQVDADAVSHPGVFVGLVNGIIVGQRDSLR